MSNVLSTDVLRDEGYFYIQFLSVFINSVAVKSHVSSMFFLYFHFAIDVNEGCEEVMIQAVKLDSHVR